MKNVTPQDRAVILFPASPPMDKRWGRVRAHGRAIVEAGLAVEEIGRLLGERMERAAKAEGSRASAEEAARWGFSWRLALRALRKEEPALLAAKRGEFGSSIPQLAVAQATEPLAEGLGDCLSELGRLGPKAPALRLWGELLAALEVLADSDARWGALRLRALAVEEASEIARAAEAAQQAGSAIGKSEPSKARALKV
jgi:hypothetical protein